MAGSKKSEKHVLVEQIVAQLRQQNASDTPSIFRRLQSMPEDSISGEVSSMGEEDLDEVIEYRVKQWTLRICRNLQANERKHSNAHRHHLHSNGERVS